jgi:hypothetical protein
MPNIEQGRQSHEYYLAANDPNNTAIKQDEVLSRRRFLKRSTGMLAGFATMSAAFDWYLIAEKIPENAREADRQYPKPSASEHTHASETVNLYNRRRDLFQECQQLYNLDACQPLRPTDIKEVQIAQRVLDQESANRLAHFKWKAGWIGMAVGHATVAILSLGVAIRNGAELMKIGINE